MFLLVVFNDDVRFFILFQPVCLIVSLITLISFSSSINHMALLSIGSQPFFLQSFLERHLDFHQIYFIMMTSAFVLIFEDPKIAASVGISTLIFQINAVVL